MTYIKYIVLLCLACSGLFARVDDRCQMGPLLCPTHLAQWEETENLYSELHGLLHLIPRYSFFSGPIPHCATCPICKKWMKPRPELDHWCDTCADFQRLVRCRNNPEDETACTMNAGYFLECNRKYLAFFLSYLQYCSENSACRCHWPQCNALAEKIHFKLRCLVLDMDCPQGHCTQGRLDSFSPYWKSNFYDVMNAGYDSSLWSHEFPKGRSIATYAFFYSQVRQICFDLANYLGEPYKAFNFIEPFQPLFLQLYNSCLSHHPHPKIYYERGMIKMHRGDVLDALRDMRKGLELAYRNPDQYFISSEMYQQEATLYSDLGLYDQALYALNNALQQDPSRKVLYFDRAVAYFELGQFDQSLTDFLVSQSPVDLEADSTSSEFHQAFYSALYKSAKESALDFVPSLCGSACGLGRVLWDCTTHPIESAKTFSHACWDAGEWLVSYFKTLDSEKIDEYAEEIKDYYTRFSFLSDAEKGDLIGSIVGKYGVDILAGSTVAKGAIALKGMAIGKRVRDANRVCTFESMAASPAAEERTVQAAKAHIAQREKYFEEIKLHRGAQNKHIQGHPHFNLNASIFEHSDPDDLLRRFSGKGVKIAGVVGEPGYREIVDFQEYIGMWVSQDGKLCLPTTKGTIHYGKKGAHIVPAHPDTEWLP